MSTPPPLLRSRPQPKSLSHDAPETSPATLRRPTRISLLDILRLLAGALLLSGTLSYLITQESLLWGWRPAFTRPARIRAFLVRFPPTLSSLIILEKTW